MIIVVDCSVIIAATLEDEESIIADKIYKHLANNEWCAIVPAIFYTEIINVLITALRRKRIDRKSWQNYHDLIAKLPLEVDDAAIKPEKIHDLSLLAEKYHLSAYDATYLELAKRKKAKLVTFDQKLHDAATLAKVAYSQH